METRVVFNRKGNLDRDGLGLVEIQIYVSRGQRPVRTTNVRLAPQFWDAKKCIVKKTHPNAEFLNAQIMAAKNKIEHLILQHQFNGAGKFSMDDLDKKSHSFYDFFQNEVMRVTNIELAKGTHIIYRRVLKYLKEYSKDIPIQKVDVSFLEGYNKFLIEKKGLAVNTRSQHFNKIRKVMGLAVMKELIPYSQNPFNKGFAVREVETESKSLTLGELMQIESIDMTLCPDLIKTRDMFLLSCYTGLRFSDLSELTTDNFAFLDNGKIRLGYVAAKTKHLYNRKVQWVISDFWNKKADEIVLRNFQLQNKKAQPFKYTNQTYNRNLKELQKFTTIKTPLTSHLGRHTCITLLINDFGLDITKAQLIAGHSKIEMTKKYLRITERDLEAAAKRIDWGE